MPPTMNRTLAGLSLAAPDLGLAACGTQGPRTTPEGAPATSASRSGSAEAISTPSRTHPAPTRVTTTLEAPRPAALHFATPDAAMGYLSAAYNRNDLAALKKVTHPKARADLLAMRAEAVNLPHRRRQRPQRADAGVS